MADYYLEFTQKDAPNVVAEDPGISLNYWSSVAEKPAITRCALTSNAFQFYRCCSQEFSEVWKRFMLAHCRPHNKKVRFNDEKIRWETNAGEVVPFQQIITWRNTVLDALLHERSLLPYFKKWAVTKPLPVEIAYHYTTIAAG